MAIDLKACLPIRMRIGLACRESIRSVKHMFRKPFMDLEPARTRIGAKNLA